MRFNIEVALGFLGGLLVSPGLYAVTPTIESGIPYQTIAVRNVFSLKNPPPITDPLPIKPELPKLKLQGIATILGRKQALVKVMAAPPSRPKEESLILNEGEGKDGIEVVSIDEVKELVNFKIAGSLVTLSIKDDAEKPAVGAVPAGASPNPPLVAQPAMVHGQDRPQQSLPPEVQQIMIEATRQKYLDEGDSRAKILPSTGLRPQDPATR